MSNFNIPNEKKSRVIINTDAKNEVDDQFAIVQALLTESFDIRGIIAAHFGDQKSKQSMIDSYDEIIKLMDLMDMNKMDLVYKGAKNALSSNKDVIESDGARLIIEEALKEDTRPLYITFLGPLTDMATALLMEPSITEKDIIVIWIGGRDWPQGGWEYNLSNDPLAANIVFESSLEVWQVPRNVYRMMPVTFAELEARVKPHGKIGQYLCDSVIEFNNASIKRPTEFRILGDSPAIGLILFDDCGQYSMKTAPSFDENLNYIHHNKNRDIRVYKNIDARFILEDLYAKLALFSEKNVMKNHYKWSVRMTESVIHKFPELRDRWAYDYGVLCRGIERAFETTKDDKYFKYIKDNMDYFVNEAGEIKYYDFNKHNIDYINNGKTLLYLYRMTKENKYKLASDTLRKQLDEQPRTSEGGFWHKDIYPHQMWLDGLYMGAPFYAEYTKIFGNVNDFDDVAKQLILMNKHAKDPKSGLLYHGYDESKEQLWANKETGCSPHFWGRAMGWYAMALVDVLDYLPENHKNRAEIVEIARSMYASVALVQGKETGVWSQVLDQEYREGNYIESSCTCMFTYAIAKAIRKGYISHIYKPVVEKAIHGIIKNFVREDEEGYLDLIDTVYCSGLGGAPYRDGTYKYYISERKVTNNLLGIGAFIQAFSEWEIMNI